MEPTDSRIRTVASPLLVAVALGMVGVHVLVDEEDGLDDDVPDCTSFPIPFTARPPA